MNKHKLQLLTLILLLVTGITAGGSPDRTEKKIVNAVESSREGAIAFLERVVNVNSGTMNPEGVRDVGSLFRKEFESLGMETQWIPQEEVSRGGHLIAEQKGSHGKRILLIGHLDTVFEKSSAFQKFRRDGKTATGPGVNDMKGGDVLILYALKALRSSGVLPKMRVIVVFTGDEEKPGEPVSISRRDLIEAARRSDLALGYETATAMNEAAIARRGMTAWTLKVEGRQGHSSGIFSEESGSGAVFEAARILHAFHDQLREQFLTFNPGIILGGTDVTFDEKASSGTAFGKTNVIARLAIVKGDLRFLTPQQLESAKTKMRSILQNPLPGSHSEIEFQDSYPPMPPTDGNQSLLKAFNQVSRDLGYGEVVAYDPGGRGAADTSFVAPHVDAMDGLGVLGEDPHTDTESIDLDSLAANTARTAILLYRLSRSPDSHH